MFKAFIDTKIQFQTFVSLQTTPRITLYNALIRVFSLSFKHHSPMHSGMKQQAVMTIGLGRRPNIQLKKHME